MEAPYEVISGSARVLLTCEHASQRMPAGWAWPDEDARRLVDTHWAYDLGAERITRELAEACGAGAVLSRFTRLLIDPNRELSSPTLFREHAESVIVQLNHGLDDAEKKRRIDGLYRPYHEALERTAATSSAETMLSIHTFTPNYEGEQRAVELGVLFDSCEREARAFGDALTRAGFALEYNEPWSGLEGLMYSVEHHAIANGKRAIEIEVRQDRAEDPAYRRKLVSAIAAYFKSRDAKTITDWA